MKSRETHKSSLFFTLGKCRDSVQQILDSMVEISRLAYLKASKRSPKTILRLHNQTFLHAMRCKMLVGKNPKQLTRRKFYGRYWHSLTCHAPIVQRIISLSSIHTEEEERTFSTVNSIATRTTSRRHNEIIAPTLVRLQAEEARKHEQIGSTYQSTFSKQNSEISKLSEALPSSTKNSIIPHGFLLKYPQEYQAHLERISDFILPGENVWWNRDIRGVEFHDGEAELDYRLEGPTMHHFRYSSIKIEQEYLRDTWLKCLESETTTIPHIKLTAHLTQDDGTTKEVEIQTTYFEDNQEDSCNNDSTEDLEELKDDGIMKNDDEDGNEHTEETEIGFIIVKDEEISPELELSDNEEDFSHQVKNVPLSVDTTSAISSAIEKTSLCKQLQSQQHKYDDIQLKTDLANCVLKVLSNDDDLALLRTMDKYRVKWKTYASKNGDNKQSRSTLIYGNYKTALANVQTKVLAAHDPLKRAMKEWDETFFLIHEQREPEVDDYKKDKKAYSTYKKLCRCKELLKHWGITLHLK